MSANVCIHGQLARVCTHCEANAQIDELRAQLAAAEKRADAEAKRADLYLDALDFAARRFEDIATAARERPHGLDGPATAGLAGASADAAHATRSAAARDARAVKP